MEKLPWNKFVWIKLIIVMVLVSGCNSNGGDTVVESSSFSYLVRVQSIQGEEIPNANVTIEVAGKAPLNDVTDSTGLARIFIDPSYLEQPGKLIVKANRYERYVQNIDLIDGTLPDVVQLNAVPPTATSPSASSPTNTPEATATERLTPTLTKPPTISPTNTATMTPTAVPTCPSPTYFEEVYQDYPQLGCPTTATTSDFTFQEFERGLMVWQKSPAPSTVYAFYDNGRWERQTDPGGSPTPSCPEAEQTDGLGPILSFGTLWCEPWNWKEQLGKPVSKEIDGENNQIQNFENGTILTVGTAEGFILFSDSQWQRF